MTMAVVGRSVHFPLRVRPAFDRDMNTSTLNTRPGLRQTKKLNFSFSTGTADGNKQGLSLLMCRRWASHRRDSLCDSVSQNRQNKTGSYGPSGVSCCTRLHKLALSVT